MDVTYTKNEDGTTLLRVVLDDFSSKCLHSLCARPEDWVENIISSGCYARVKDRHCEPPVGKCVENEDDSCMIEVEIDAVHGECMQEIFSNVPEQIKYIISERINIEADEIMDQAMDPNKSRYQIVMEHQITAPVQADEDIPFVDQTAEALQTTKEALQTTKEDLQTTATNLQTTKTELKADLQTTRTELAEERALHETTRTQLRNTQTELDVAKIKLLNIEARMQIIESNISKVVV
jgi:hypothetical protein